MTLYSNTCPFTSFSPFFFFFFHRHAQPKWCQRTAVNTQYAMRSDIITLQMNNPTHTISQYNIILSRMHETNKILQHLMCCHSFLRLIITLVNPLSQNVNSEVPNRHNHAGSSNILKLSSNLFSLGIIFFAF